MTMLPDVNPQSTGKATPVIADAASEARNPTALATSTGSTMRPSGYQRLSVSRTFGILGGAPIPKRRAHSARQDDVGADAEAAVLLRQ